MHPPTPVAGLTPGLPVTEVGDEAATVFPGNPVQSGRFVVVVAAAAAAAAVVAAAAVEAINSQELKGLAQSFKHFTNGSSLFLFNTWSKYPISFDVCL